jgi:hypothetical protein
LLPTVDKDGKALVVSMPPLKIKTKTAGQFHMSLPRRVSGGAAVAATEQHEDSEGNEESEGEEVVDEPLMKVEKGAVGKRLEFQDLQMVEGQLIYFTCGQCVSFSLFPSPSHNPQPPSSEVCSPSCFCSVVD